MTAASLPVLAEVVRNSFVESRHHGSVVALGADGSVVLDVGDTTSPVLPRSSNKPLQAVGMLRAGWDPPDDECLALATASHSGEPRHVTVVRRILAAAGLDATALGNTPDLPLDAAAAAALLRDGGAADPLHQNCSGKHAAMLATCVAAGWSREGYLDPAHPVQRALRDALADLTGEPVAATAVDGCGAPLFSASLRGLARAFAALATAAPDTDLRRVADAMRSRPDLVGGTGRDVTAVMTAVPGLVAKDGAEGVYAAALADGRAVALKIEDGGGRARPPVLVAALRALGVDAIGLAAVADVPVLGHGRPVGQVRAVELAALSTGIASDG